MLPLLVLTYTAVRLGFEAQNAAAFRLLRLGRGITTTAADEIVPEAIVPPDTAQAPVVVAPKRRHAATKVHKKSTTPVKKRNKRAK